MTEPSDQTAEQIAARGRDALIARLRPAFEEAAAAHADVLQLGPEQIESMVQRAADRADGLQWRRALASVATEELGISLGEALSHPAVVQAHELIGAPSYEESLASLGSLPPRPAPQVEREGEAEGPSPEPDAGALPDAEVEAESVPSTDADAEAGTPVSEAETEIQPAPGSEVEPEAEGEPAPEAEVEAEPEVEPEPEPEVEPERQPEPRAEAEAEVEAEPEAEHALKHEPGLPVPPQLQALEADDEEDGLPETYVPPPTRLPEPEAHEPGLPEPDEDELGPEPADDEDDVGGSTAEYSPFDEYYDEDEGLRMAVVHLGGIANLEPSERDIELLMSPDGLDIIRARNDVLGRLEWDQVKALEVPQTRSRRRMRKPGPTHLVIRTLRGDASFEVPEVTPTELRQHLAPVIAEHLRRD